MANRYRINNSTRLTQLDANTQRPVPDPTTRAVNCCAVMKLESNRTRLSPNTHKRWKTIYITLSCPKRATQHSTKLIIHKMTNSPTGHRSKLLRNSEKPSAHSQTPCSSATGRQNGEPVHRLPAAVRYRWPEDQFPRRVRRSSEHPPQPVPLTLPGAVSSTGSAFTNSVIPPGAGFLIRLRRLLLTAEPTTTVLTRTVPLTLPGAASTPQEPYSRPFPTGTSKE